MQAVAVHPGLPNSMHLREIPEPELTEIPAGRGVKVELLQVLIGVDGTDREINAASSGQSTPEETTS